jgi:hypothetical protein
VGARDTAAMQDRPRQWGLLHDYGVVRISAGISVGFR